MRIIPTDSAQQWIDQFPEINIPATAHECFSGLRSIKGLTASSIKDDIILTLGKFNIARQSLSKQISNLIGDKSVAYNPLDLTVADLINNISIRYITTKDEGTRLKVRNLFKYRSFPLSHLNDDEEVIWSSDEENLLGVYLPKTGSIMLWIDKIIKMPNPELILQKVLLHELIHAYLDINPRILKLSRDKIQCTPQGYSPREPKFEESIDNALVLKVYEGNQEAFSKIKEFIENQPAPYYSIKAVELYEKGEAEILKSIQCFLSVKVVATENSDIYNNKPSYYTIIDGTESKYDDDLAVFKSHWQDLPESLSDILEIKALSHPTNQWNDDLLLKAWLSNPIIIDAEKIEEITIKAIIKDRSESYSYWPIRLVVSFEKKFIYIFNETDEILYRHYEKLKSTNIFSNKDAKALVCMITLINPHSHYEINSFLDKNNQNTVSDFGKAIDDNTDEYGVIHWENIQIPDLDVKDVRIEDVPPVENIKSKK